MLTRLKLRKDFRWTLRLLSDKPPDKSTILSDAPANVEKADSNDDASTDKIKSLLKTMMETNKINRETDFAKAPIIPKKTKHSTEDAEFETEKIEDTITIAASEVAKVMGGDIKQTESELLSKVLGKINENPTDLSKLLGGMKVSRSAEADDELQYESRGQQVKRLVGKSRFAGQGSKPVQWRQQKVREQRSPMQVTTIDIFSGQPSGIFQKPETVKYGTKLETWERLEKRELMLATAQPPSNYFQKMILWTKQGKVWKFPINNEQGLEEEDKIHFSEHIFLETQLDGWCPQKGPVRHFMELVCTGLSKNPFYTVQEKRDHIKWYKEYFESKKDLLTEVGVWQNVASTEQNQKSL